ncbi:uncharacterized protein G2W53_013846 [Senna tora]|uniref:Uncharacterized protein n=1 Tax=Senna tora TaxID=362788 RepID=A0A834WRF8_9FABA|nr:uncharacterized protein G2W53_013846 [Senna tora]
MKEQSISVVAKNGSRGVFMKMLVISETFREKREEVGILVFEMLNKISGIVKSVKDKSL